MNSLILCSLGSSVYTAILCYVFFRLGASRGKTINNAIQRPARKTSKDKAEEFGPDDFWNDVTPKAMNEVGEK